MTRLGMLMGLPTLVVLALLTGCASSSDADSAQEETTEQTERTLEIGTAAGRRTGQTPIDALIGVETIADRQLDILRTYSFWDSEFPDLREQWANRDGRELHLSVNARREDGTVVPWREIADAEPGTQVHDELVTWIAQIADFDGPLRVTFHHEADIEPEFGTPQDFVDAWRRFAEMVDEAAPDVPMAWVMTLFTLSKPDEAEQFWPGDDHVDWIAADAFNWFGCRGTPEPWRAPALLLDPLIEFGVSHPGKPLMLAEIGSDEDDDDPDRKAAWYDELGRLLATQAYEPIETVIFFHNDHDDQSTCDWWLDSSPAAATSFAELANSDVFDGPNAPAPPSQCPTASTTFSLPDDLALVDGDGDGRFDFEFGEENRFLGIGDQSNDGADHRVVLRFDAIDLPPDATVELRVRTGSRQPALTSPIELVLLDAEGAASDPFAATGTVLDPAWFDDTTPDGHHTIDLTDRFDPTTTTTFRLQLTSLPPDDDGKAALFIGMGDASRSIDRPALVVRSC